MSFLLVALVAVGDPQLPLIRPKPPKLKLPTGEILTPAAIDAVAEPVGAMLNKPFTLVVLDVIDLAPDPDKIRFE